MPASLCQMSTCPRNRELLLGMAKPTVRVRRLVPTPFTLPVGRVPVKDHCFHWEKGMRAQLHRMPGMCLCYLPL